MLLGSRLLEVNATNQSGLTALDLLLIFPSEAGDREIQEILCNAGAMRTKDVTLSSIPSSPEPFNQTLVNSTPGTPQACTPRTDDLVEYFKFNKGRDSPGETRTALLVIAVLVATATFQVGVNPPGGVWSDNYIPDQNNGTSSSNNKAHKAGRSILGSLNTTTFCLFMFFNSVGFSLSLHMINMLTIKFPLQFELQICIAAMFFTYNTAVTALAPDNLWLFLTVVTSSLPAIMPLLAKSVRKYAKMLRVLVLNLVRRALTGDVQKLHQLLGENPLTLHTVSLASSENPLHVASASAYGHIDFVKEITRLRPDFAKELNEDGFSPMHMASANGYLEVVMELMKVDRKLCRLQGRENKTALHLAVIKGRVDVIK
ncbi:hypothetical protein LWI29_036389 [Acer saccharum]|uniref:PGG domain-containing protein n=1 Tax=Acer saccharum TaxID=4024 RepID=A0AA39SKD7_ACESA|nr:hypothetical protein LWI29_036389 [Acer saccharum]